MIQNSAATANTGPNKEARESMLVLRGKICIECEVFSSYGSGSHRTRLTAFIMIYVTFRCDNFSEASEYNHMLREMEIVFLLFPEEEKCGENQQVFCGRMCAKMCGSREMNIRRMMNRLAGDSPPPNLSADS